MNKVCRKCGKKKPIGEFYPDATVKSGVKARCKVCTSPKGNYGVGAGNPTTRWTKDEISRLQDSYDEHVAAGKTRMELARAIAEDVGRTPFAVRRAVGVHLNLTLIPGKVSIQKLDTIPKKMEPVAPVPMIDGIEETDFGSYDLWKKAVEKLREKGKDAKVKNGSCYIDGRTVSLGLFCHEAGLGDRL